MNLKRMLMKNPRLRKLALRLAMKFVVQPRLARLGVPIVAITGTNGKTTIVRLLTRIYRNAGYNVGTCSTYGVTHNEKLVSKQDEAWGSGAWRAARCPNVDLLILEVARGGLARYGLGFKKCQVGVVTNVYEDHLGYEGIHTLEQMAKLKSAVPRATDKGGAIILNADDSLVRGMAGKSDAEPIHFGMIKDHREFDKVFSLKGNSIWKRFGTVEESVIDIKEIPITLYGEQSFNVANVMAVLAAVEGARKFIPVDSAAVVTKTLREFGTHPHDNLGTFHIITLQGERVILCNAKNPASFRFEIEVIKKIKEKEGFDHIAGILSAAGNRNNRYYQEMSEMASHACDLVLVSPPKDHYMRGRHPREIVTLLSSRIPQNRIVNDESLTLSQWISLSRSRLGGRILFVVFSSITYPKIDVFEKLADMESLYTTL
jgi:cyanophycin synthetase